MPLVVYRAELRTSVISALGEIWFFYFFVLVLVMVNFSFLKIQVEIWILKPLCSPNAGQEMFIVCT